MTSPSEKPAVDAPRAGREIVLLANRPPRDFRRDLRNLGIAGACLLLAGTLGWAGGTRLGAAPAPDAAAQQKAEMAQLMGESEAAQHRESLKLADEVHALKAQLTTLQSSLERGRSTDEVKALKASVESLKQGLDAAKSDTQGTLVQLSGKLDHADQGTAQKLVQIADRLDRLERNKPDPMPTGSIAPVPPQRPSSAQALPVPANVQPLPKVADARPQPAQKEQLQGWVLRDVYDGVALVEGRDGYREVMVGEALPGAGRIQAIERRGRNWVVVTSLGLIGPAMN